MFRVAAPRILAPIVVYIPVKKRALPDMGTRDYRSNSLGPHRIVYPNSRE